MNYIYPSKNFLINTKKIINSHEVLNISINGWRGSILAKEVGAWLPVGEACELGGELFKAPSAVCSLLMLPLFTIHYFALSANYEMQSNVDGKSVVLTYVPRFKS